MRATLLPNRADPAAAPLPVSQLRCEVALPDGTRAEYGAKLLARDPSHELSVLVLDAAPSPPLRAVPALGATDQLRVGQRLYLLGGPGGGGTATLSAGERQGGSLCARQCSCVHLAATPVGTTAWPAPAAAAPQAC